MTDTKAQVASASASNVTSLAVMREKASAPERLRNVPASFFDAEGFAFMQRVATLLSSSTLVPAQYRAYDERKKLKNENAIPNCVVAINMAQRMNADILMVMQNLYNIEGRPSWSSQWIIAAINGCGRFSPLRFEITDAGEKEVAYTLTEWNNGRSSSVQKKVTVRDLHCVAWAIEKDTGERITSPEVSIEMAVKEGWYGKNGSKWQTMPEVMLRYRTASFFGKLYAPELLMGLQTLEEAQDGIIDVTPEPEPAAKPVESLRRPHRTPSPAPEPEAKTPDVIDPNTGEILNRNLDADQDAALREVEQRGQASAKAGVEPRKNANQTPPNPAPDAGSAAGSGACAPGLTLDDAREAVRAGDYDAALDIARDLNPEQRAIVHRMVDSARAEDGALILE